MNYPKYPFTSSSKSLIFEFVSNGINGSINKAISYTCVNEKDQIYNLCFGDNLGIDPETGELKIDDLAVSNNRDMPKILATVASSAYIFSKEYPDRKIFSEVVLLPEPDYIDRQFQRNMMKYRKILIYLVQ